MKKRTARDLHLTISRAMKGLAILAAEPSPAGREASGLLGALPLMATNKAVKVLESAAPSEPCTLSDALASALTEANLIFHYAVKKRPGQFSFARKKWLWPSLRYGRRVRREDDEFDQTAKSIGLGADLAGGWGIKAKGAIKFGSVAVVETLNHVMHLNALQKEPDTQFALDSQTQLSLPMQNPETKLPPLSKDPEAQSLWWKAIAPLLEADRDILLRTASLKRYRKAAVKGLACKDTSRRAKEEAGAWNYFKSDCRKALKRLAPPAAEKIAKSP